MLQFNKLSIKEKTNHDLAIQTADTYLQSLVEYIKSFSDDQIRSLQSSSKRKDGLTVKQTCMIFNHVNSFFTLKWPSVI